MRLGTAITPDETVPVLVTDAGLHPLEGRPSLLDWIAGPREELEDAAIAAQRAPHLHGARLTAPIRPPKIVAIGLNYQDHIREQGADAPERPLVFAKFPSCVIGDGDPIPIDPEVTGKVDWEVELGVVVGSPITRASEDEVMDSVFGYTVANDVTARDLQRSDRQWTRAKSLDGFCPLGPVVVTADAISQPQNLKLRTKVNGETMQDSSTSEMLFGIAKLLAYCSHGFSFEPGDLLLTGTPWGVGAYMDPRRFLAPGDEVEVEVEAIGSLTNPVVAVGD
ncbi:fumarylacetoacetate hydrolase family protein [Thermoleophilia bacterium SCSIO 60948]|nr:fumarylacetoacetate hydrolase family protein [Thermoleophilia bacterium SCSIO 60948]